jgi:hypothetical protein
VFVVGTLSGNVLAPGVAISRVVDAADFSVRTGIRLLPTTVVFYGNRVLSVMLGLPDQSAILSAIRQLASPQTAAAVDVRNPSPQDFLRLKPIRELVQEGW